MTTFKFLKDLSNLSQEESKTWDNRIVLWKRKQRIEEESTWKKGKVATAWRRMRTSEEEVYWRRHVPSNLEKLIGWDAMLHASTLTRASSIQEHWLVVVKRPLCVSWIEVRSRCYVIRCCNNLILSRVRFWMLVSNFFEVGIFHKLFN